MPDAKTHETHAAPRTRTVLGLAAAVFACAAVLVFRASGPCDDDFIVYRYARNLVEGHGLVFTDGARVEGFTCPAWMVLVAGALALGVAAPLASAMFGLAS